MLAASILLEALRDLWGPGLVFLALCAWLVRRALRAARNESVLEEQRLQQSMADLVTPAQPAAPETPAPAPLRVPQQLQGADVRGATQAHLEAVAKLQLEREAPVSAQRSEVLWVRSAGDHVAWCERSIPAAPATRKNEVLCVARIDEGRIVARWSYG
jgi:hypothetical protein